MENRIAPKTKRKGGLKMLLWLSGYSVRLVSVRSRVQSSLGAYNTYSKFILYVLSL